MAYDYLFISINEQSWVNIELHALKKKNKNYKKEIYFLFDFLFMIFYVLVSK